MPCRLCGIIIIRYYLLADSADAERYELTAIYLSCCVARCLMEHQGLEKRQSLFLGRRGTYGCGRE